MKNFVFRINESGFYDWLRSIWKMRLIINSYNNTQCDDYKEYIKSSFQEANLLYKEYLDFRKKCSENELKFLDEIIRKKIPDRKSSFSFNELYKKWVRNVAEKGNITVHEISSVKVGIAIREAREFKCYTRKQVAQILKISCDTLRAYELGTRKLPFEVFYKLKQFLDISFDACSF